jgi:hypothetical protein
VCRVSCGGAALLATDSVVAVTLVPVVGVLTVLVLTRRVLVIGVSNTTGARSTTRATTVVSIVGRGAVTGVVVLVIGTVRVSSVTGIAAVGPVATLTSVG